MTETVTIQYLYDKMGEYTQMDTELAFDEFQKYYQDLMDFLMKNYQEQGREELVQLKGMCMIVCANAQSRSMKKDQYRKKFAKMAEKCRFWEEAIKLNLIKSGMTEDELDEQVGQLWFK